MGFCQQTLKLQMPAINMPWIEDPLGDQWRYEGAWVGEEHQIQALRPLTWGAKFRRENNFSHLLGQTKYKRHVEVASCWTKPIFHLNQVTNNERKRKAQTIFFPSHSIFIFLQDRTPFELETWNNRNNSTNHKVINSPKKKKNHLKSQFGKIE